MKLTTWNYMSLRVFAVLVLILGGSLTVWSQQITSSITGTVMHEALVSKSRTYARC